MEEISLKVKKILKTPEDQIATVDFIPCISTFDLSHKQNKKNIFHSMFFVQQQTTIIMLFWWTFL